MTTNASQLQRQLPAPVRPDSLILFRAPPAARFADIEIALNFCHFYFHFHTENEVMKITQQTPPLATTTSDACRKVTRVLMLQLVPTCCCGCSRCCSCYLQQTISIMMRIMKIA